MKVIVNGRFLLHKVTGVERYAGEILAELDKIIDWGEVEMAVPPETERMPTYKNIKVVKVGKLHNRLWEHISFPWYVRKQKAISLNLCNVGPLPLPGIVCMANTWTSISTEEFLKHLNEAYAVNLLGMAILGVSTNYYDHKKQVGRGYNKIISFTYYNILSKQIRWIAFIFAIVFFVYIYIGAGGIPLFNGNRQFAQGSNQFVYILLQGAVYFLAWYFVGSASDRKISCYDILCLAVLSADLLFTANRTPPLKIIYAFLIVLITARKKIKYSDIFKQFRYAILIALAGVIIVVVRAGGGLSNITYIFINSIVFGNTFCDIRDGARVLFGYHRMYDMPLMGKTYLASLLSFIPSSLADSNIPILSGIAEFRSIYSAGQWTTYTLFGLTNHYGLRGGMFLLSYMNFGIIGVVLISIVLGYWYGNCEVLYRNSIKYKDSISIKGLLISTCFASAFFELLYAPAGFNQTWGFLLIIIIFTIIRGKVSLKRRLPNV